MDFERRIERLHRAAEKRCAQADARMKRVDAREAARQVKIEKQNQITRRYIEDAAKIVADIGRKQRETQHKLDALIDAQNRFLESMVRVCDRSTGSSRAR